MLRQVQTRLGGTCLRHAAVQQFRLLSGGEGVGGTPSLVVCKSYREYATAVASSAGAKITDIQTNEEFETEIRKKGASVSS